MRRETLLNPRTLYINKGYLDPKPHLTRAHLAADAAIKPSDDSTHQNTLYIFVKKKRIGPAKSQCTRSLCNKLRASIGYNNSYLERGE